MSQKLKLALLSNAGGSGKTTLSTHLTYLLAKAGYKTILFDLDSQGSMNLFSNLEAPEPNHSSNPQTQNFLPIFHCDRASM